ncbi:MAG: hypothetical protein HXX09_11705, partial [Bacteroidetes bacterium]|nr:hypothetical protein [Bacteroidota bacterium]
MKKRLLIIILFFNFLAAFPQHESDYWYFGFNAGMHFVSGTPVALTDGAMYTWEGCSALTNGNGDLMFYTDGRKVWNNTHQVMPNGNGLLGDSSSTQSGMVVELPGVNKQYYLFTVDELGGADGLRYSIIDMNLDGGKGDIFQKNVALHNPVSEKISATFHSNNSNVWVLTHDWGSNAFYTYLVSPTGVDSTPVISNIGLPQSGGTLNSIGYMKFSPDGTKIALCVFGTGDIEIFDFDASTGIVSNPIIFPTQYSWAYSIEFSPDNSRLYVSQALIPRMLYQFNLNAGS